MNEQKLPADPTSLVLGIISRLLLWIIGNTNFSYEHNWFGNGKQKFARIQC